MNLHSTRDLIKPLSADDPVVAFADSLGASLVSSDLYGMQHKLTIKALETCFDQLMAILSRASRIDVACSEDGQLALNRSPVADVTPRLLALTRRLNALKISGFSMKSGLDAQEFMNLMIYLARPRAGDGAGASPRTLEDAGLPHVTATRTVVTQVEDGDGQPEPPTEAAGRGVQQILAFLKGTAGEGGDAREGQEAVRAADPAALADLIMDAVAVRQAAGIAGGESLGDLVVGCLRRTFGALNSGPAAKTAKGKKDVKRTLAVLEEKIVERLRAMAAEGLEDAEPAATEELEGLKEEIEIEDVVAQYMRSRRAEEDKEEKLLRYMRRKRVAEGGAPELRKHLEAEGLAAEEWDSLVVRCAGQASSGGTAGHGQSDEKLPLLLAELTRVLESKAAPAEVDRVVESVGGGFRQVAKRMAVEIEGVQSAPRRTASERQALQGRALLLLRELVQQLCQPLSVMNGAVQMLLDRHSGELDNSQRQLLTLAVECSEQIHVLAKRLIELAGVPAGFAPDGCMIEGLYQGKT